MMLRSVLLPQPEWPTIVDELALLDLEAHVPEDAHLAPGLPSREGTS